MISFHGKQSLKDQLLSNLKAHEKNDESIQGRFWKDSKGYERLYGIPIGLVQLEGGIFEGLSVEDSKWWPLAFSEAIPVGIDLSKVAKRFTIWLLEDVKRYASGDRAERIQRIIDLCNTEFAGEEVSTREWYDISHAASAASSAASSAAHAAASASAARAAAGTVGRAAAYASAAAAHKAYAAAHDVYAAAHDAYASAAAAHKAYAASPAAHDTVRDAFEYFSADMEVATGLVIANDADDVLVAAGGIGALVLAAAAPAPGAPDAARAGVPLAAARKGQAEKLIELLMAEPNSL